MIWMDFKRFFEFVVAHRRNGEDVFQAADRMLATYAYFDCTGRHPDEGAHSILMARMLRIDGIDNGCRNPALQMVRRKVRKHRLRELEL